MRQKTGSAFCAVIGSICLSWLAGCSSETQHELRWPEVTHETKPWTRWWWHGSAVTNEGLTAALGAYRDTGLGGVEITPIYGVRGQEDRFIDYLSPAWMEALTCTLGEAKRLDMGVDLANASGWPFGGPWVTEADASKGMYTKTWQLRGGQQLKEPVEYIQMPLVRKQGEAIDQMRPEKALPLIVLTANRVGEKGFAETLDLTEKVVDSKLDWTAPAGDWTLCAIFQGNHGKWVERAGPGGEGLVIDHFSPSALKAYLDVFDKAFAGYDLSYLRYYFNDSYEVDDAVGEADFTPALFSSFEELNGYDLKQYLPALFGLDTEEMNARVRYDYRRTISDLLLTAFTQPWQQWAAAQGKGIRNQAHGSPANVLDLYAASDVPEIEGEDPINLKAAASAAHVSGRNLVAAEACTWLDEHFLTTLGHAKEAVDGLLLAGVNHVVYHGTAYSPQEAVWPGWLFYASVHFTPANPFWNDFRALNQYVTRAQSFLQAGRPDNDILLYLPMGDYWSEPADGRLRHLNAPDFFDATTLKAAGAWLSENGYAWDAITDKQLPDVSFDAGEGTFLAGGNVYKAILVPETQRMPVQTFEHLVSLARAGAPILFEKQIPTGVPGLAGLDVAQQWPEDLAKGVVSGDLATLTAAGGLIPEPMYAAGLQSIRRRTADGNTYYFVRNAQAEPFDGWVGLSAPMASAALYNPMTGQDGYAHTRTKGSATELYLQLQPGETVAIETFRKAYSGRLYPYYQPAGEVVELSGTWNITFLNGGPTLPEAVTTDSLRSWTEFGEAYRPFSGSAEYTIRIPALTAEADAWRLDLGDVRESAVVRLNGEALGTLISPPFTLDIPAGKLKGNDELRITVSNGMANRIIDLDKRGIEWKIFYNTNMNARDRTNTNPAGKFTAAHWTPRPSGLISNVTFTPLCSY